MSALRYVGSKQKMLGMIEQFVSQVNFKKYIWVEPFCGSICVPLHFINNKNITHFHLNDANPSLIRFYQILQKTKPGSDKRKISKKLNSLFVQLSNNLNAYYDIRKAFNKSHSLMNDYKFVATFYFINRAAFNGVQSYNQKGEFNVAVGKGLSNFDTLNDQLSNFHSRIYESKERISFYNTDCINFIKTFKKNRTNAFYYCDPPYDGSHVKYTSKVFIDQDQINLFEVLSNLKNPFMVHNANTTFIRKIYSKFKQTIVPVLRKVGRIPSSRGFVEEIIITNFV